MSSGWYCKIYDLFSQLENVALHSLMSVLLTNIPLMIYKLLDSDFEVTRVPKLDGAGENDKVNSENSVRLITAFTNNQICNTFAHVINERISGLTTAEKRDIIKGKYPNKCFLTNIKSGLRNKRRGQQKPYPRQGIIGDAAKRKVGLHHLAAYMSSKRFPEDNEVASHWFCDNPDCGNPAHIVWESQPENVSRYGCKVALQKAAPNYRCHHLPVCPGHKSCYD